MHDAYEANDLDGEARKFWGACYEDNKWEYQNHTKHDRIELYSGRGGKRLITLADCDRAKEALSTTNTK